MLIWPPSTGAFWASGARAARAPLAPPRRLIVARPACMAATIVDWPPSSRRSFLTRLSAWSSPASCTCAASATCERAHRFGATIIFAFAACWHPQPAGRPSEANRSQPPLLVGLQLGHFISSSQSVPTCNSLGAHSSLGRAPCQLAAARVGNSSGKHQPGALDSWAPIVLKLAKRAGAAGRE